MDTQAQKRSNRHIYTETYTHIYCTHGGPDATWAVPGELQDTVILKLLMTIINHMLLNHFRDREGGGEREGNKMRIMKRGRCRKE